MSIDVLLKENKRLQDELRFPANQLSIVPVQQFMKASDQPPATLQTFLLYQQLTNEEFNQEFLLWCDIFNRIRNGETVYDSKDGHIIDLQEAVIKILDGGLDTIFTVVGALEGLGCDVIGGWNEVCRTNIAKIGADGKVHKHPVTGKVLKPEGWVEPDLSKYVPEV